MISDIISDKLYILQLREIEKRKIAVLIDSLQTAKFISDFTDEWNTCHKDFPGIKKVTLFTSKPSQFANLFIFLNR